MMALVGFVITFGVALGVFARAGAAPRSKAVAPLPSSIDEILAAAARELGMAGATFLRKEFDHSLVVERVVMVHSEPDKRVPFMRGSRLDPWTVFCGKVLERGTPLVVDNSSLNSWRNHVASFRYGMERYCGAPVEACGKVVGVVGFFDFHSSPHLMGIREKEFVGAVALKLERLMADLQENSLSIPEVEPDFRIAA